MDKKEVKDKFKHRFDYLCLKEIDEYYELALGDYLMLKYPHGNLKELPNDDNYAHNWIYSRMVEIVENLGISSFVGYNENGVSMSKDNTHISNGLRSMVVPKVGTIKRG